MHEAGTNPLRKQVQSLGSLRSPPIGGLDASEVA
jgi:hypothetical protein